jgi:magnesium-protoporphyrin IX monomethyl ester (oxidative) cyclase
MDALPIPTFDHYFASLKLHGLREHVLPSLSIEASRGCWWGERKHCRFCGLNGSSMAYRAKSGKRVLREITELGQRYAIERFMLTDNILQLEHVQTVFDELAARKTPYRFFCEIKANMTADQMRRLAKGGVTAVQPGIESLDDETLRSMEKGVSALHNIRLLRVCTELGMAVSWNLLSGIPDETSAAYMRMRERIPLIEHLSPPSGCSPIRIDRFSPYFDRSAELGFTDVLPAWAYAHIYDLPDSELGDLAYFFDGKPRNASSFAHLDVLRSMIDAWRKRHYECEEAPVLAILELGPLIVVRDTRSCVQTELRVLSQAEANMLRLLRDVAPIDRTLTTFRELHADEDAEAAFARLVAWKYIIADGNRALSLVADFSERVFEADEVRNAMGRIVSGEVTAA